MDTLDDEACLEAFLRCALTAAEFNHRNHLRIAWMHLQRYPLDDAIARTCDGIARLAAHLGVPERANRTLTEAVMRLMAYHGAADPRLPWETFIANTPALLTDCKTLIARHYSPELIARARHRFLPPDRLPLPR
jgi:N-formylglutamate deformylase